MSSLKHLIAAKVLLWGTGLGIVPALAQSPSPPPEDIPEEVLQTEIITEARSPFDGRPLTAAEYAQLQDQLRIATEDVPGRVSPGIQRNVVLLRIRKLLRPLLPFLIK